MSQLKNDKKPEDVERSAKRRNIFLHWGASGVAVASAAVVAALLFGECQRPQPPPPPPPCCEAPNRCLTPAEVEAIKTAHYRPPVKGDGQCEVDKGEHDPHSPTYDAQSCGRCGDGIQQVWNAKRIVNGQEQTVELGRETPEAWPADFHCREGAERRAVTYGGVLATAGEGNTAAYSYGLVPMQISCNPTDSNYCPDACGGPTKVPAGGAGRGGSGSGGRVGTVTRPEPVRPEPGTVSAQCPDEVINRLRRPARDSLTAAATEVRSAAGALPGASVPVTVGFSVRSGIPRATSVSVAGVSASRVDLSSVSFTPDVTCSSAVTVTVSGN